MTLYFVTPKNRFSKKMIKRSGSCASRAEIQYFISLSFRASPVYTQVLLQNSPEKHGASSQPLWISNDYCIKKKHETLEIFTTGS